MIRLTIRLSLVFIALQFSSVVFSQPGQSGPAGPQRSIRRPKPQPDTKIKTDVSEALTIIEQNYVGRQQVNYDDLFKSSLLGMLHALDPHSNYFDKKEFEAQQAEWARSEYYGIGATISDRRVRGDKADTYVIATFPDAPAFRAGLRYGDRIVEVDGQSMAGKVSAEVRDKLRGPRGSTVRVTVERASTGTRETVAIVRDAVPQPTIPDAYMLQPGIGYVDMTRGFNRSTSQEFIGAVERLKAAGMSALVLDLRNNGGGFLIEAVKIVERLIPMGQLILDQRGTGPTSGGALAYASRNPSPETFPVTVLVNRGTASASEILAGALQDQDRALIVGETSFGKGLVQTIYPLDSGGGLTLTTSRYHTPSGRAIQRDYENTSAYDYLSQGGVGAREGSSDNAVPKGPASRTAGGRLVYGGGIAPDKNGAVKPRVFSRTQLRLVDPIFGFARELVNGRVAGFESFKVNRMPNFDHNLQPGDLNIDDRLFKSFKSYVASNKEFFKTVTDAQLDREREFIRRQLRYDLATASYGTVKAVQVLISDDPQVLKAVELMPAARDLAAASKQ
jgi:carboxyl-terminal processing protease